MVLNNRVVLAALFHWTIFTNLDPGIATLPTTEDNTEITRINPELSFRPVLPGNGTLATARPLVSFNASERESYYPLVQSLEMFLTGQRSTPDLITGNDLRAKITDWIEITRSPLLVSIHLSIFVQCLYTFIRSMEEYLFCDEAFFQIIQQWFELGMRALYAYFEASALSESTIPTTNLLLDEIEIMPYFLKSDKKRSHLKLAQTAKCIRIVLSISSSHAYRRPDLVPGRKDNIVICAHDLPPMPGRVCEIDVQQFGPCSAENNFGYGKSAPCIFLKFDTPSGWKPEFYNDTNSLPEKMPQYLKASIQHLGHIRPHELNTVWISCEGDNPGDEGNIGPISYYPRMGIPSYYFANNDAEGYLSPVIAVFFERPRVGVLINITCKVWARNIAHNDSALGGVEFALLVNR